jgi:hypothetical protein
MVRPVDDLTGTVDTSLTTVAGLGTFLDTNGREVSAVLLVVAYDVVVDMNELHAS